MGAFISYLRGLCRSTPCYRALDTDGGENSIVGSPACLASVATGEPYMLAMGREAIRHTREYVMQGGTDTEYMEVMIQRCVITKVFSRKADTRYYKLIDISPVLQEALDTIEHNTVKENVSSTVECSMLGRGWVCHARFYQWLADLDYLDDHNSDISTEPEPAVDPPQCPEYTIMAPTNQPPPPPPYVVHQPAPAVCQSPPPMSITSKSYENIYVPPIQQATLRETQSFPNMGEADRISPNMVEASRISAKRNVQITPPEEGCSLRSGLPYKRSRLLGHSTLINNPAFDDDISDIYPLAPVNTPEGSTADLSSLFLDSGGETPLIMDTTL